MIILKTFEISQDPQGLILSLVSISVVFTALIILWLLFNLSNNYFASKEQVKKSPKTNNINSNQNEAELAVIIALAINRYKKEKEEAFVLTIKDTQTQWRDKRINFRKVPKL